jgi:hypothetical protein
MKTILAVTTLLLFALPATAEPEQPPMFSGRYEVWMGITSWPGITELQPLAAGTFDEIGFGIGGAFHGSLKRFENSEILVGVDTYIGGTASNVSGVIDDLIARDLYLGASVKWALGRSRGLQLDAGAGYHLLDMAQVSTQIIGIEHQVWQSNRLGTFVGATWDPWAGKESRSSGLSLAFKVHFVEFGAVRDEDIFLEPILGPNAGRIEGPLYLFQVGFSGR